MNSIHFLLASDKSAARLIRRALVSRHARLGVVVGTWLELVEHARNAYLLPEPEDVWLEALSQAAAKLKNAFWEKSLEAAPAETISIVGQSLEMLIQGAGPGAAVAPVKKGLLPERARKHLADLARLHEAMGGILPPEFGVIKELLGAKKGIALRSITVYYRDGLPRLSPWQKALLDKLEKDNNAAREKDLEALLTDLPFAPASRKKPTALAALQDNLFVPETKQVKLDHSVQWLAVRDYLEEVEVAVGMVQKAIEEEKLKPSDIGLLIPADRGYAVAVRDTFALAGIPLSGMTTDRPFRDLGREAVLYFLLCRRTPAPVMALAALFTSSLMPWSREQGSAFASQVMKGKYRFNLDKLQPTARQMVTLIRQDTEQPAVLAEAVQQFVGFLDFFGEMTEHRQNAIAAGEEVTAALRKISGEMPWKEIISLAAPKSLSVARSQVFSREGIAVFREDAEPWRSVLKLFVLGFESNRYPAKPGRFAVFSEEDLISLKQKLGYDIETASEATNRGRDLLRRQLSAASGAVTFLVPKRDAAGKPLQPSASLPFMARLFKDLDDPMKLLLDLDTDAGRLSARGLEVAREKKPECCRMLKKCDLNLGQDLLKLRKHEDGTPKPESPSYIETLIISPLGWFLERNGLVPSEWRGEELDPASKGTLAHEVFENLFTPGKALPDEAAIRNAIPSLLNKAVIKMKPMLLAKEWRIEYQHLVKELEDSALRWREFLVKTGATVVGAEVELTGSLDMLPLSGKTDLLIALPGGRMFVVDYKKSKSKKRRAQMEKGWDSQTSLYRVMLKTGGVKDGMNKDIANAIEAASDVGVLYYMMNDQTILADTAEWIGRDMAGVEEMGANISQNAMAQILERIKELRNGVLILNSKGDDKEIEKETGMTAKYAFEKSPLVQLFMKEEEEPA